MRPKSAGDKAQTAAEAAELVRTAPAVRLTPELLGDIANRPTRMVARFVEALNECTARYGVNTLLRQAHFLAQVLHECDRLATTTEYASGDAYDTRTDLGNTPQRDGDGRRYKGRGLIQCTGDDNYEAYTRHVRKLHGAEAPDFDRHPELVAELPWCVDVAGWFWDYKGLNAYADRDDLRGITRRVNGGYNGLTHRRELLARSKNLLLAAHLARVAIELRAAGEARPVEPRPAVHPVPSTVPSTQAL